MTTTLFLQGSLFGSNSRDGRPLFMEPVSTGPKAGRPLLGMLLDEAAASGCFDTTVFVTSADACDDAVADYLKKAWPTVETVRLEADSPFAFAPDSRSYDMLHSVDYGGILSIDGFRAVARRLVDDPSAVCFVLDVNDAPLCSRRYFELALPLARDGGLYAPIKPGTTSLCAFPIQLFDRMAGHQRAVRNGDAAVARERTERAIAAIRHENYLAAEEQIETVESWKRARAERYGAQRGGLLAHAVRDWLARHGDSGERERFTRETEGEAVSITTRTGVAMVQATTELPAPDDVHAANEWLRAYAARAPHGEAQKRFCPDYPSYLEVELTSRCNLACAHCPQTRLSRAKTDMTYEAFAQLVERVGDFVILLNVSGFGEPTLHPRLFDCVRFAKSKGIPRVGIETNGTTIDETFLDEVFASGLDILTINLDALDQADQPPFGSVFELLRSIIERRAGSHRPFVVLQRVNMAVADQDAKNQRDFTLWHDVADSLRTAL